MNRISAAFSIMFTGIKNVSATLIPDWIIAPFYHKGGFGKNASRFTKNELIFACIEKTTNAASQINILLRNKRTLLVEHEHTLQKLIREPNPFMSETDLYEAIILLQMLSGRAVLEKERNNAGEVIGLWPLRPDWLEIIPSKQNIISGFMYGPYGSQRDFIPYADTVDLPLKDPRMPIVAFNPVAPVSVASRVVDTDDIATDYIKMVFDKGGVPPGLLKTKQKLIDSQVTSIRKRWAERYGGAMNWLEPAVLDSDAEYQKIGQTIEEMGFLTLDRRNESRICMVLDIPPIIVGAFVGVELSSYDNYLTARQAWWQDSLLPKFWNVRNRLWTELRYEYPDTEDLYLELDVSRVFALAEQVDLKWRRAADAFRTGGITVNMYLDQIGFPTIGSQGDIFLRPLAYIEVPMKTDRTSTRSELKRLPPDHEARQEYEELMQGGVQEAFDGSFSELKRRLEKDGVEAILAE